jgi:hypothetical protein
MALRQTTGYVESLLGLIGLDSAAPDFITMEPSPEDLEGKPTVDRLLHLLVDSPADYSLSRLACQSQVNRPGFRDGDPLP